MTAHFEAFTSWEVLPGTTPTLWHCYCTSLVDMSDQHFSGLHATQAAERNQEETRSQAVQRQAQLAADLAQALAARDSALARLEALQHGG